MFPYVVGREFLSGDGRAERWIIDLTGLDLLCAAQFSGAFGWLKQHVLPEVQARLGTAKDRNQDMLRARADHLDRWWTMWSPKVELRDVLAKKLRVIVASRIQRAPFVFAFMGTQVRPSDKLQVFGFDDDYSFGVVQSVCHSLWYKTRAARLKNEVDYSYSAESIFDTFPWPQSPTKKQINAVAAAGREIRRIRAEALPKLTGGLRALYRTLELPGRSPLKDAHAALDEAVLAAYGFNAPNPKSKIENPKSDDLLAQLLALNLDVAARLGRHEPVTAPGVPPTYGDPAPLITDDCIQP